MSHLKNAISLSLLLLTVPVVSSQASSAEPDAVNSNY